MKRRFILIALVAFFIVGVAEAQPGKSTACDLKSDMRKLWEDHITWTRNVILNIIDDLPGTSQAVARLLENQVDIGNAIKPYYGAPAGDHLTALLHDHITIAASILTALKTNNTAAFTTANAQWYVNADSIAKFLSTLNPAWGYADLKTMMFRHLDLTAAEAVARLQANYSADVTAYDNVHGEILQMSDMLTDGIVSQFPNKFRGGAVTKMSQHAELSNTDVVLNQNAPNPFRDQTVITYVVPETVKQAQLLVYDERGILVKRVELQERGEGSLTLQASKLRKGMYSYSIVADGRVVDTRRMMH